MQVQVPLDFGASPRRRPMVTRNISVESTPTYGSYFNYMRGYIWRKQLSDGKSNVAKSSQ